MTVTTLALTGIFSSGRAVLYEALGLLAIVVLVVSGISAAGAMTREGAGSAIMRILGGIVLAALLVMSPAIASGATKIMHDKGLDQQAPGSVIQPWGQ